MRKALDHPDKDCGDDGVGPRQWLVACLGMLLRRPHDTLAGAAGLAALVTVLANALFLQAAPHPAPLFPVTVKPPAATARESTDGVALPRPRPSELASRAEPAARSEPSIRAEVAGRPEPVRAPPHRSRSEIVTDIQRELARRGLYDGPVDGIYGGKTDAAIRSFEKAAGLPLSGEASEAILKSMTRAPQGGKQMAAAANAGPPSEPAAPPVQTEGAAPQSRSEPGVAIAPKRVRAAQQALSDFGYGQVKPTGNLDAATRTAIETFEKVHKLPITGQISEQFLHELGEVTDRPIE